jgi:hypothetical protein
MSFPVLAPVRVSDDLKYECEKCETTNVKLWREAHSSSPVIKCALCLGVAGYVKDGYVPYRRKGRTDQIGVFVPFVPDHDGRIYGYTSVPKELVDWWHSLPDY